ncbi:adenylate/guanylate cyclase domain-containing protein [Oxynema aestuarii]|uniref:NACHT domain-containing protein n=1 Tax=Oxynema aestuarii AP17 TaxID=2064643 RepID=A0A6H1TW06_9CYAN|nr:adenylate/guanylate cyclase domain-containing protein [Oxynema aestuarii]QIZ70337.1 NACHT domain-containing protein [Oxynema aestuarii AP17]
MNNITSDLDGCERVLAAIVFSDAVDFSARMRSNEPRTLALIQRDQTIMKAICERYQGEVIKSTGDGLLIKFSNLNSSLQAVNCAIEIQKELAKNAENLDSEAILYHRIGIHFGEVFAISNDVMGHTVNVAARLESQAEPGGICLSKTVYDLTKKTLSVQVRYLGHRELKNISNSFPVYHISLGTESNNVSGALSRTRLSKQDYRNRQVLLDKVYNYWITGVLEHSLHARLLWEIGITPRPDMLDGSWNSVLKTAQTWQRYSARTRAIDIFNNLGAGRTLLILGQPGSGKTITLLEIARSLIDRAKYNVSLAIPVVFNLSSWSAKKQPIDRWLIGELKGKYQLSKEIAEKCVKEQNLLLLLDGLDEVSVESREACVEAINDFCHQFGQTEMIVCCRLRDYQALHHRLQLQDAIYLQPLRLEQIRAYLSFGGEKLAALSLLIETDKTLQKLARSPLMLSIMMFAYRGIPVENLIKKETLEERRQHLFDTYVCKLFDHRGGQQKYSLKTTKYWLSYLAKQLKKQGETIFSIEQIQSSWLPNSWGKFKYHLEFCLLFGAIFGAVLFLLFPVVFPHTNLTCPSWVFLVYGMVGGSSVGIYAAIAWTLLNRLLGKRIRSSVGGLIFSLVGGFAILPTVASVYMTSCLIDNFAIEGLFSFQSTIAYLGSFFPLFYLISALNAISFWAVLRTSISPSMKLKWSPTLAKKKLIYGMIWGLKSGLILGLIYWITLVEEILPTVLLVTYPLSPLARLTILILASELIGGLIGGMLGFFIGGLTGMTISTTTMPNQGIWHTLYNAICLGGMTTLIWGAIAASFGSHFSIVAIPLGVAVGMMSGGITALKHLLLRLNLRSLGLIPWNYARFLNYATSCIFLQKVGGGYIFVHRLLLEHFAAMDWRSRSSGGRSK